MSVLDTWSLVAIAIGIVGTLAGVWFEGRVARFVGAALGVLGIVLSVVLHVESSRAKAEQAAATREAKMIDLIRSNHAELVDAITDTKHSIERSGAGRMELISSYEQFLSLITDEVQKTNHRWFVTRLSSKQARRDGERAYFDALKQRLSAGEILEHRRLLWLPSDELTQACSNLLSELGDCQALEIRLWSPNSPRPQFELLVGDEVVFLVGSATSEGGPPSQGFVLRGRAFADLAALAYSVFWNLPANTIVKDRVQLDTDGIVDAQSIVRQAGPATPRTQRPPVEERDSAAAQQPEPRSRGAETARSTPRHGGAQSDESTDPATGSAKHAAEVKMD